MFTDVLVPTDGSDCASQAVGYAEDLAERFDATLHLLSVADARIMQHGPHSDEVRAECADIVEAARRDLSSTATVEVAVRTDLPHEAIVAYAADAGIDLIVMGTHGRTGVERYLLGSVAERVVRSADVPVLTVRCGDDAVTYPYSDVLVPTDGSAGAEAAVGPAIEVAAAYDARLHALSVLETEALGFDADAEPVRHALDDRGRAAVEAVRRLASDAGVRDVETAVVDGAAYREIVSYAESNGVDLIVMGTHGRTGLERYLLGSVAEKTIRRSPVPVMTVRERRSESDDPEE